MRCDLQYQALQLQQYIECVAQSHVILHETSGFTRLSAYGNDTKNRYRLDLFLVKEVQLL